jgi:hypothetical protein
MWISVLVACWTTATPTPGVATPAAPAPPLVAAPPPAPAVPAALAPAEDAALGGLVSPFGEWTDGDKWLVDIGPAEIRPNAIIDPAGSCRTRYRIEVREGTSVTVDCEHFEAFTVEGDHLLRGPTRLRRKSRRWVVPGPGAFDPALLGVARPLGGSPAVLVADVDHDGEDDTVVLAVDPSRGERGTGRVLVFHGVEGGLLLDLPTADVAQQAELPRWWEHWLDLTPAGLAIRHRAPE